jgi:RNA polymerase sigma-70 factor (ECF subfamily)
MTKKLSSMSSAYANQQQLCQRILQGNEAALRTLYQQITPKLRSYFLSKLESNQDVEELMQDTLLAFLDALPLFNHQSSIWTFVVGIAKHEVADYYRKRYAKKVIKSLPLLSDLYDQQLHSSDETATELRLAITKVYQQLAPKQKLILQLKYEHGLSVTSIAKQLGVSPKAAESLLFRSRLAFQKAYTAQVG